MKKIVLSALILCSAMSIKAQKEIPLYEGPVPDSKPCTIKESSAVPGRVSGVTIPTLAIFYPTQPDSFRTSVLIFPGGGYARLATGHEGYDIAREFNKYGITAFVVKYRLPNDTCMTNKENVPLEDAQQAIKLLRSKAAGWNLDPTKIGIIGFSAGGHLAASLGTKFGKALIPNKNKASLRPDFMILGYPVISFSDSLAHKGSRENLIGKNASEEMIKAYSNELLVTPETTPTFLFHAADDKTVNVQNSIVFYQALLLNKVPAEMKLYQGGGHGFGMINKTTNDKWFPQVINWIKSNGWMKGDVGM